MRVTLVGAGNVATVLGRKILEGGHIIQQVYSRNSEHASSLARELSAEAVNEISDTADMYIVAVADEALNNITEWMKPVKGFVVHTAGSVSINVLQNVAPSYGVLWPVQSIRKETAATPFLPLVIDANNAWNRTKLQAFAQSFGDSVTMADDEQRSKLHLAAVVTNNFTNYLLTLTKDYCDREGVDFMTLLPLLNETVARLQFDDPARLQTGPAARGDISTMNKHRELLRNDPKLLEVYEFFSGRIGGVRGER